MSSNNIHNKRRVQLLAATFALSGAAINMFQQQLFYMGAGDGSSMILIVPTFVGMLVGGLVSSETRHELQLQTRQPHMFNGEVRRRMKQLVWVSVFDVTSLTLRSMSQNLCGSGMFTVIYAILPAFNGALSYCLFKRILNKWQWMSILIVIVGLAISAEEEEDELGSEKKRKEVAWGIGLGLLGTLASSSSYLSAERVLQDKVNAPRHGTTVTAINGINDVLITLPWLLFYSLPNRQELLYKPIQQQGYQTITIVTTWLLLVGANAAHLNSCYVLLQVTESVTLTMLQGLRAVLVFFVSGLLFCNPNHPEQCLSIQKAGCSMMVVMGVILYAKNTPGLSSSSSSSAQTTPTESNKKRALHKSKLSFYEGEEYVNNDHSCGTTIMEEQEEGMIIKSSHSGQSSNGERKRHVISKQ